MLKLTCLPLIALMSFSAFAQVSFEEKKNRIEFLEELAQEAVSMDIDAYRRELLYEKQNLSLEKRAENEANLLAERIKAQVQKTYAASLEDKSSQEAMNEVKEAIDKDLELISEDLREEIRVIAYNALDNAERGYSHSESDLSQIQKVLMKGVRERYNYLNEVGEDLPYADVAGMGAAVKSSSDDSSRKSYKSRSEIVSSLVSERENAKFIMTSNIAYRSEDLTKREGNISVRLKAEFLGVQVDAGPTISFTREISTAFNVMGEGLSPVVLPDGNFDFVKRDSLGRAIKAGKDHQLRRVVFTCEAKLSFESNYSGGGGFSVAGVGASGSLAKKYSNSVTLNSRRIEVPEYIDNKSVTVKLLNEICHKDFLKARITTNMNVSQSLDIMMKNVLAGVRFSHPKSKCVVDNQCAGWYRSVLPIVRANNVARCVEESREKYRACELRGLRGQNCTVYDSTGKRISDGMAEFKCDTGLRCVKIRDEGWLKNWSLYQYAKGVCR